MLGKAGITHNNDQVEGLGLAGLVGLHGTAQPLLCPPPPAYTSREHVGEGEVLSLPLQKEHVNLSVLPSPLHTHSSCLSPLLSPPSCEKVEYVRTEEK